MSAITLNHPKHHQKSYLNVYACLDFRGPPGPGLGGPGADPGPVRARAGPTLYMNFNFSLKIQFWSYDHVKTFFVIGNKSV